MPPPQLARCRKHRNLNLVVCILARRNPPGKTVLRNENDDREGYPLSLYSRYERGARIRRVSRRQSSGWLGGACVHCWL
ncbi:hypothetical protein KCP70_22425 [Salmonella enterica subsp. enterica]|nr:hypothetical protein KCP70_22425 [Salmonella enterica subsp. enterica]